MRTLLLSLIISLFAITVWAAQANTPVNLTYPATDQEMLDAEVVKNDSITTVNELLQGVLNGYISERRGHWEQPNEVILRLTPAEINQIPPGIRAQLGL